MAASLLPIVGKVNFWVSRIPWVGEPLVRGQSRLAAQIAFHMPLVGGKKSATVEGVKSEWRKFLGLAGMNLDITREDADSFEFKVSSCPYGFRKAEEKKVCDACMDLDRTYVRLLGGELEVLESIPGGANCCRCVVRVRA